MTNKVNPDKYAAGLFDRTEDYAEKVREHYVEAVNRLLDISASIDLKPGETFSFSDYPKLSDQTKKVITQLYSRVYREIQQGVKAEWSYANLSCDEMVVAVFGKSIQDNNLFARWFSRNQEAMDAFFARKSEDEGLNLSQKVWNYTGQLRQEMEMALDVSLGEGVSARTVSRRVRKYLQEPEKLFHKVKNKYGNLVPSKAMKAYHPGQGVYRSSAQNAMRLARSEPNLAYRMADYERWQQLGFVVGIEVKTSKKHKKRDICDLLAGKYPKGFIFTGFHPQCFCFAVPILADLEEMVNYQKDVLAGKKMGDFYSKNTVYDLPDNYKDWIVQNADRIKSAKALPYFIKYNYKNGDIAQGLVKPLPVKVDPVEEAKKKKLEIAIKGAEKKIAEAAKMELKDAAIDELKEALQSGNVNQINKKANKVYHLLKDAKEALKDPLSPKVLEKQFGQEATAALFEAFENFKKKIAAYDLAKQVKKVEFEIDWVTKHGQYATSPKMVELLQRYLPEVKAKAEKALLIDSAKSLIAKFAGNKELKKIVNDLEKVIANDASADVIKKAMAELEKERLKKLYEKDVSFFNSGDKFDISQAWTKEEREEINRLRWKLIDVTDKNHGNIRAYEVVEAQQELADKLNELGMKYVARQKAIRHIGYISKGKGEAEYPYFTAEQAEKAYQDYIQAPQWKTYYSSPIGGVYKNGGHREALEDYVKRVNQNGGMIVHEASLPARYFAGQSFINQYLLGFDYSTVLANPELKKLLDNYIPALSYSVNKLPRYHGITYRGVRIVGDDDVQITSVLEAMKSGKPLVYNTVMSTSTSIHTADGFGTGITFKIYSRSGIYGDDFSVFSGEKEVLLRAGSRFKVIDAYKATGSNDIAREGNWVVIMEEILE